MNHLNLTYWDYVKEAFHLKVETPALGALPLNKLFLAGFAILGFGHEGFWFLGFAFEAAYIALLAGSIRFQKLIQGRKLVERNYLVLEKKQQFYVQLNEQSRTRYDLLNVTVKKILFSLKQLRGVKGDVDMETQDIGQLQWIFLNLLLTRQKIRKTLAEVNKSALESAVKELNGKLEKIDINSTIYRSLTSDLEIQEKRLLNLKKAEDNLAFAEAEMSRIENQLNLLKEELATTTDADLLSLRLDGVLDSLDGAAKWMSDHVELLQND
jgi:hypothetical protein